MFVRTLAKQVHCTVYQNFSILLQTTMSQKSLLSFFQKKPVITERSLNGVTSDVGKLSYSSDSANAEKPGDKCNSLETSKSPSNADSLDKKSKKTKSSSAKNNEELSSMKKTAKSPSVKDEKSSCAKKTTAKKITGKIEVSSDTEELADNAKSFDKKSKRSEKTAVKKASKITKGEKTLTAKKVKKCNKSSDTEDSKSPDTNNRSADREKSPEATQSPIVQKKRRRVAIIESDGEDESAEVLPPSKKTRTSSDEEDTEAAEKKVDAEAVVEDVDSRKAKARTFSDKVDTETADQNVDVDEVGVEADSKKLVNEIDEESSEPPEKKKNHDAEVCDTPKPVLRTLSYLGTKKKRSPKTKKPSAEKMKSKSPKDKKNVAKTSVKPDDGKEQSKPVELNSSIRPKRGESEEKEMERENDVQKTSDTVSSNKENSTSLLNRKNASDIIGSEYNPGKEKYDPIKDAYWKEEEKTPYLALAKTLQKVEETSARLKIIEILSNYFRSVIVLNEKDLLPSIYLCLNKLGPAYEGQELGIAETYLMKAIAQCTGRTLAQIKTDAAESGDLGLVAEQSRSNQRIMFRPAHLTVQSVFSQLSEIAAISGQSAVSKKIDKIQALFVACRDCEARFVIRSLAGKMRIGLAEQSVLQALALACTTTPPNQERPHAILNAAKTVSAVEFKKRVEDELLILKTTYCECPNYNMIVPVLLQDGVKALPEHCKITPGIPVKPMLAQPTKGVQEVLQRFEGIKFTCEWKYDGERAQIHVQEDGTIKIYSRNQEDNTSKYPDIIDDIRTTFKAEVKSCILDAEAVAWDRELKKIMPFQILSTRKRKDANASEIKVRVCVFLFDVLYLNGESLTQKTLAERRELLKGHFQEVDEKFRFVTSIDTHTMEEVQECLEESVKGNCEGLMIKTLDTEATYEIAKRSRNWLKLKKDYLEGCGDTLDLVVIGGYIGKGKRTGQYGGFLLASYDADNEEYQTICKIGTGFTEEALATHSEFLKQHIIPSAKPYYRYDTSHEPDHWFDAVQVWEVKCADLSLSPIYLSAVGLVDPEKGISLRFPRFVRIRDDKSVEQATSSQQVAELYQNQDQIKNGPTTSNFNEEDF